MNIKEFATEFGVVIGRCSGDWGGTFSYHLTDSPHVVFNGYKTERKAYEGWLEETFDKRGKKAIMKLIRQSEKLKPKFTVDLGYGDCYRS